MALMQRVIGTTGILFFLASAPLAAQDRTSDNAVTQGEDAVRFSVGRESLGMGASVAIASQAPVPPQLLAKLDERARKIVADGITAGLAIAVIGDGRILFERGYGKENLENVTPVSPATVFRIASVAKQFTAAAVLRLVEQGKVALDDPASKYLPTFPPDDEVTIRHLLNHTSGIKNVTSVERFLKVDLRLGFTSSEYLDYIQRLEPLFVTQPGSAREYNNTGYILLSLIVEKASNRTLSQYLAAEIFPRAGMTSAALDVGPEIVANRAAGYELICRDPAEKKCSPAGFRSSDPISLTAVLGAGAIRASIRDMARWQLALARGRVVSPASYQLMTTPARLSDGRLADTGRAKAAGDRAYYGMGLRLHRIGGIESIGHSGSLNGFESSMYTHVKSGITVAVLSNTGSASDISGELTNFLFAGLGDPTTRQQAGR